eukprot:scaffold195_cov95-Cyclotella_meneghiniana.AAC.1
MDGRTANPEVHRDSLQGYPGEETILVPRKVSAKNVGNIQCDRTNDMQVEAISADNAHIHTS